jgi:chromosome segregation ATPase
MDLALAAGDLDSYGKLASLYQTAHKIYAPSETTAGDASSLNATQQGNLAKLESAGSAIDQLEQLYNQAGGGQGRLGGKIAELGASLGMNSAASSYNSAARGLVNQIAAAVGKTDSLNTEGEVQRALDLVPKITDTQEEAQAKLQSLRSMLNANKQTYQNIYGVSQQ